MYVYTSLACLVPIEDSMKLSDRSLWAAWCGSSARGAGAVNCRAVPAALCQGILVHQWNKTNTGMLCEVGLTEKARANTHRWFVSRFLREEKKCILKRIKHTMGSCRQLWPLGWNYSRFLIVCCIRRFLHTTGVHCHRIIQGCPTLRWSVVRNWWL